ncbi:hypothetical protein EDM56_13255 [Brevibacillus fluminis]|uniref:Uncharacterized protein n=1 Tax=Brevibacillus fluminis TaxID=511487 RepID=A0A3M8DI63_9BACL|nr:hypothetical protein EDM56_13255 [Brevibacillus fluminis]
MNCQEFRSKWEHSIDDAVYEHIETCEDCLNWIETSTSALEEAMFLKEYPAPSAQLEDRIMQAIYQTSGTNNVPLSATVLPAAGDIQVQKPNKRRFFVPTWVAAAGVVVAVGLIGAPFLTGNQSEQFAEVASSPPSESQTQGGTTANEAAQPKSAQPLMAPTTTANNAQAEQPAAAADQLAQASTETEAASANKTAAQAKTGAGGDVNAANAKKVVPLLTEQAAGLKVPAAESKIAAAPKTAASASTQASNAHAALTARSKTPPTMANKQDATPPTAADTTAPAIADSKHAIASIQGENGNTVAAFVGPQLPEKQPDSTLAEAGELTAKQALGPENPITLSTFNDVETAVQASDLPVPTLAKLPPDYTLNMLTVQYESQTSKHVTNIQTIYQLANSGKRITIDTTLQQGKRSLSVPGEFSNTQVFQIDGEQAIGVTFKDSAEPSANKSAVYYQAVKGGHSLYIVVTADGIPLNDLMEMTKQITWKTK